MAGYQLRVVLGFLCMATTCWRSVAGQSAAELQGAADAESQWAPMIGTWTVESAERDGDNVPGMQEMLYFFEPGLMRWASPKVKNEITKMPVLMGRLLKHVEGNRFRVEAIYPPGENAEIEIAVEGDALVMIIKSGIADPVLTVTLKRKNERSPKPPPEKMIGLARQSLEKGDRFAANLYSQLQLINFPKDKEAALLLAESGLGHALALKGGSNAANRQRIQSQAEWALNNYPQEHALRHEFAAFLFRYMLFEEANVQYDLLEQARQFEPDSLLKHVQCEIRLGNVNKARALLEQMIGYDGKEHAFTGGERTKEPNSGYIVLASRLAAEGKPEEAVAVMDRFIQVHPDHPKPYVDRGRFYMSQSHAEAARKDFATALAVAPTDYESMLVNIESRLREPSDEVDQLIADALAAHDRQPLLLVLAATRAGLKQELDQSLALIEEGLTVSPKHQSLASLRVQILTQKGDHDAAQARIDDLSSIGAPTLMVQTLQAKLHMAKNEFSRATRILASVDTSQAPAGVKVQIEHLRQALKDAIDAAARESPERESPEREDPGNGDGNPLLDTNRRP
jgi:hypothetical protein